MKTGPQTRRYNLEFINEALLEARADETLLEASLASGIPHFHACGGKAKCSTCRVLVEEGWDNLSPPNALELALAKRLKFSRGIRLACQSRVEKGVVRLHRLVRDTVDLELNPGRGGDETTGGLGKEGELVLFFLDIRDFTRFAESHLPFDVMHLLNRFHRLVGKIIEEEKGTIVETAGDGIYAVYGLKTNLEAAVEAAVGSAQRILSDLERFNRNYALPFFNHRIQVGIGIHAGRVIYGHIGIGVGNALSVIGHPVNVASRIESATRKLNNSIVVSEPVYRLMNNPPPDPKSAEIKLKGVKELCRVYLLGQPYR